MRASRATRQRSRAGLIVAAAGVLAGVGALVVSAAGIPAASPPSEVPAAVSDEALGESVASRPARVVLETRAAEQAKAPQARAPRMVLPPPMEAVSVNRVQAMSGQAGPPRSSSTGNVPFSIVLVAQDQDLDLLAGDVATRLNSAGVSALSGTLAGAGRPDVLVLLDTSPKGSDAWYCDPGPAASARLASMLLEAVGRIVPGASGTTADENDDPPLACDLVLEGRAGTAAALVRLDSGLASNRAALSQALTEATQRYLGENASAIRQARASAKLIWPARGGVSSHYGPDHPLGIDIGQLTGSIVAATDGTVVWAGGDPCCSYGLYIIIDSPSGIRTLYAHLSDIAVRVGDRVRQGQAIGLVGCTGRCFGAHLHFEVFSSGVRQDPMRFLP